MTRFEPLLASPRMTPVAATENELRTVPSAGSSSEIISVTSSIAYREPARNARPVVEPDGDPGSAYDVTIEPSDGSITKIVSGCVAKFELVT